MERNHATAWKGFTVEDYTMSGKNHAMMWRRITS